jgi:hypothetical protein
MLEDYSIPIGPFIDTLLIVSRISNFPYLHGYPLNIGMKPIFCQTLQITQLNF